MDSLIDDRNQGSTRYGPTFEGRPSTDARSPQTPRLQKKKSTAGARSAPQAQSTRAAVESQRPSEEPREGNKARKPSLRNAVRRLFGRRSRDVEQPPQTSPPRHGYHRSEPYTMLAPQAEVVDSHEEGDDDRVRRTFSTPSAPFEVLPSLAVQRTRSPYAVEFPQSSRLKPLNLGDPYTAPGSQLRRRKTLPSVIVTGRDADVVAAAIGPPQEFRSADDDDLNIGQALSTVGEKRRSRSASDLKSAASQGGIPRKRSDEIRYWRESFQPSVLRASGFTVVPRDETPTQAEEEEVTPVPKIEDPFTTQAEAPRSSPPRRGLEVVGSDFASPSALGSQFSQDIEDRVAKLEAGLRSFRGELASLAADRNRRTILVGGVPPLRRRASSGGRTASMLAETLQSDLEPSGYEYDYNPTLRPATSPQGPRTPPTQYARPAVGQALSSHPLQEDDPFTSTPSPPRAATGGAGAGATSAAGSSRPQKQPQEYTFRSLYEMLADERSARRRLEMQMRGLREEIANLHYQVSSTSNFQSQRSSYYAAMDPQVGSTRLHALLRDTEESPPRSRQRGGRGDTSMNPRVVSRFSGSDSEAGGMAESTELETPYEAYQTPIGEGNFTFGGPATATTRVGARNDGEMF